jgi:hypothetical protein
VLALILTARATTAPSPSTSVLATLQLANAAPEQFAKRLQLKDLHGRKDFKQRRLLFDAKAALRLPQFGQAGEKPCRRFLVPTISFGECLHLTPDTGLSPHQITSTAFKTAHDLGDRPRLVFRQFKALLHHARHPRPDALLELRALLRGTATPPGGLVLAGQWSGDGRGHQNGCRKQSDGQTRRH